MINTLEQYLGKTHEEVLVVKLSKLIEESDPTNNSIVSEEILFSLEQVVQELEMVNVNTLMSQTTTLILLPQTTYRNPIQPHIQ